MTDIASYSKLWMSVNQSLLFYCEDVTVGFYNAAFSFSPKCTFNPVLVFINCAWRWFHWKLLGFWCGTCKVLLVVWRRIIMQNWGRSVSLYESLEWVRRGLLGLKCFFFFLTVKQEAWKHLPEDLILLLITANAHSQLSYRWLCTNNASCVTSTDNQCFMDTIFYVAQAIIWQTVSRAVGLDYLQFNFNNTFAHLNKGILCFSFGSCSAALCLFSPRSATECWVWWQYKLTVPQFCFLTKQLMLILMFRCIKHLIKCLINDKWSQLRAWSLCFQSTKTLWKEFESYMTDVHVVSWCLMLVTVWTDERGTWRHLLRKEPTCVPSIKSWVGMS